MAFILKQEICANYYLNKAIKSTCAPCDINGKSVIYKYFLHVQMAYKFQDF